MSLKLNERYPGRMNNPSPDYPAGSFKNRTTPDSKDGSYLEKDWANDKEGFFQSIVAAAGATPNGTVDKVGASQFFDCLLQLAQNQVAQAFPTAGTATALTLTPTPAISAYAANQRFSVKFHVDSGVNPTINASAKGAKSLKQYDSTGAKVAAVFAANQLGDIEYDGADFVLLDQLPAAGRLIGIQYFGASGTYTPNPLTKSYIVKLVAGGGAGGAARATSDGYYSGGAGGGAGGYAESRITTGIAPVAVTIGVGGVSTLNANGGNGGNSSFGSITCVGGTGGAYQSTQFTIGTVTQLAGADGGFATGGNLINGAGGQGQRLLLVGAGNNTAGNGGQSFWSAGGGAARGSNGTGGHGTYGSGGGGALSESAPAGSRVAGNGGNGFCIVEEYA